MEKIDWYRTMPDAEFYPKFMYRKEVDQNRAAIVEAFNKLCPRLDNSKNNVYAYVKAAIDLHKTLSNHMYYPRFSEEFIQSHIDVPYKELAKEFYDNSFSNTTRLYLKMKWAF